MVISLFFALRWTRHEVGREGGEWAQRGRRPGNYDLLPIAMSEQPQYYRISDPLESLNIRIRLRKVSVRSVLHVSDHQRDVCKAHESSALQVGSTNAR